MALKIFIVQSVYNWIVSNELTPYLLISNNENQAIVPENMIDLDKKTLLNISPSSIENLVFKENKIQFDVTKNEEIANIIVYAGAILELYANETSEGIYVGLDGKIAIKENQNKEKISTNYLHLV